MSKLCGYFLFMTVYFGLSAITDAINGQDAWATACAFLSAMSAVCFLDELKN